MLKKYWEIVRGVPENNRKVPKTPRKVCEISSGITDAYCTLDFPLYYSNMLFIFLNLKSSI